MTDSGSPPDENISLAIPVDVGPVPMPPGLSQVKSDIGRVIVDESTNTLILMEAPPLIYRMDKLAHQMDQPLETRVFALNNSPVKTMVLLIQEAVTKGMGKVAMDERTNQVMVTDYPAKLEELARMIKAFDERSLEVFIEAKILQVSLSDKFQLGIDWQDFLSKQLKLQGLTGLGLTSGGRIIFSSLDKKRAGEAEIVLEALRTYGDTRILSEPRLTVVNNQEAKILVGSKEPYVTTQISQAGTGTAITAEQVSFIDVGVKLFVTPTITRDGFVQMKIRPEVSSKMGTLTTSQKNDIPIVETAEAETVLLVESGGTVILGGLIKDEVSSDQNRIPVLGDIPLLGRVFRTNKETTKRTELVVFLTPRIVSGTLREQAVDALRVSPEVETDGAGYYSMLMESVQRVANTQARPAETKGTVVVEFTVASTGRLEGPPRVVDSEMKKLNSFAKQAVISAAPFPRFPIRFEKGAKTFKVPITYE